jgi:hypothetical protein
MFAAERDPSQTRRAGQSLLESLLQIVEDLRGQDEDVRQPFFTDSAG